ncbi:MAG: EAL domain-containing protein [Candidatus Thiodiazotropha sp.]
MADLKNSRIPGVAGLLRNEVSAWLVLVISLLFTLLAWYIASQYTESRASERFAFQVEDARSRILKRMLEYEQVLRGGVAFVDTLGRDPTRAEWHEYVTGLDIEQYYPGIQGIGYSIMFPAEGLAEHVTAVRAQGFPDYRVKPPGARDRYSAIIYLEPFDWRNRRAFGYDMYSNPMRRAAMEYARDTGQPSVSGKVILVQETEQDVQAGFLVYLPVYRPNGSLNTIAQRREALQGYVYSPFRMDDLMRGILGSDNPDVGFQIYDGPMAMSEENLLYDSRQGEHALRVAEWQQTTHMALAGRTWQARFFSQPSFEQAMYSSQPGIIAIGGTLVDLLLFAVIWSLAGQRRRAEQMAQAMTADLVTITQRLDLAQASVDMGTWDYDLKLDRLYWDERMREIYQIPKSQAEPCYDTWKNAVHEDDRENVVNQFLSALQGESEFNTQFRIRTPRGQVRVIEAHGTVLRDQGSRAVRVVGVNQDVTDRTHDQEQLKLAASVFDHAREGIMITDHQERIIKVNPTFCQLTGFAAEEVIGQTPRLLKSGHHSTDFYKNLWKHLTDAGYWHGEIWNRRKTGEIFSELLTISAVKNPREEVSHFVAIFSDITKIKDQQVRLEQMAHFDALTQLPNRVLLGDRMTQAMSMARRNGTLLAICYLDLDGFKPVNDHYGHDIGDNLLVKVAQRLNEHIRSSDTAARLGGDEFVLLVNDLSSVQECEQTMTRLLEMLSVSYPVKGQSIMISASVGVTLYPNDEADADTLLRHADQAMYLAKEHGRNRYHLFDPEQDRLARAHREALSRIELALQREEFTLYYQPKVDMRRGVMIGAEALIRWVHPQRGVLPPGEFLPIVDEGDFSVRLGEWVIRQVLRQLAQWNEQDLRTTVSVNISGRHFQQPGFSARLAQLMADFSDVLPDQLELEVLETSALEDILVVSQMIQECQQLGVKVALDDFGTGYSSLIYLKRLPADILKIDQTFVRDMLDDAEDLAIIEGIIGLCRTFRRQVIAEGIETDQHGAMLLRLGCEWGQGFGIARPMPAAMIPSWSREYVPSDAWKKAARLPN